MTSPWLRIPLGRDPQRLTFEDVDSKKPQLVNGASFAGQGARSECERDHEEGRLEVVARRRQSGPFGRGAQSRRIITKWAVSNAADSERQALAAMHSDVVGL
jgi:hypothetical protein